jgi:glycosyltransferase involved in cell wall biosynthesis
MTIPHAPSVALIGSYVPRRCGIATFTHDLATGLADAVYEEPLSSTQKIGIVALNDIEEGYSYGPEAVCEIRHHSKENYRAAADFLNYSKYDVVCVQHEYGIFGGDSGDYLLALTDRLTKPVVCTLHTVLAEPTRGQREVLCALAERSSAMIVMADRAYHMLEDVFEIPREKIRLIHHGVPDVPFRDTSSYKARFEVADRPTILTFGLLSENKGIETMLDALALVVDDYPDVAYIVLGATHPGVKRESGESYRLSLEKRSVDLGIAKNVIFHNRYVTLEDLCEYLMAADLYVTPYRNREQITSGTLAYALATGRAVASTPYWYAEELLADGRGMLFDFGDVESLAKIIRKTLGNEKDREVFRQRAYDFGRQMTWSSVANQYAEVFTKAAQESGIPHEPVAVIPKPTFRLSLPEVHLDHLLRMTDDTGLIQHAIHATPNRHHGYSIDDAARGMIAAAMSYMLFQDSSVLKPLHTYLSYVHYAQASNGRFRNFMSFDRTWIDAGDSDDAQGRVFWALGYVLSHPPDRQSAALCTTLFDQTVPLFEDVRFIRSMAFAVLGCHYYLRKNPKAANIERMLRDLAGKISAAFDKNTSDDWPWYEDVVTYDNARISQALILAGLQLDDDAFVQRGIHLLDWLLKVQTGDQGHISLIGNDGWLRRGKPKPEFDQQPLEIAALIGACKAAYRASDDPRYLNEMRRCFDWFMGSNDIGRPVADFKTRGCHDGLTADGVNENQGAESLLAWLLSLLTMHEMQSGDPTSAG